MQLTHRNLCDVAVKWLKRTNSNGGHGCHVAVSEVASGWSGEIPDSIGFRATGDHTDGSVVVEVKITRSDFLADKKKPHRNGVTIGMGNWRYYMCPVDLIRPEELPDKFGLLYVNSRGHVKPIITPFKTGNYFDLTESLKKMRFNSDSKREAFLMIKLLSRIGDPEKLNNGLKEARNYGTHYQKLYQASSEKLLNLQRKHNRLKQRENIVVMGKDGRNKLVEF